jgi:hypothetical protein
MPGMPCGCCQRCQCCIDKTQPSGYRVTISGVVDDGCGACSNWNASFDLERGPKDGHCFTYLIDLSEADPAICGEAPEISVSIDCAEYTQFSVLIKSGEASNFAQSFYLPPTEEIQEPVDCFEEDMPFTDFFQVGTMGGCDFSGASATVSPL